MLDEIVVTTITNNPAIDSVSKNEFIEWAPIISPSVVLLLFFIGQLFDSYKRRKESKRALYYKIHLEPAINELNEFFQAIDKLVLNSKGEVRGDTIKDPKTLVKIKKLIANKKRAFEDTTLFIIQPNYPQIYIDSADILNNFQDEIYEIIEKGEQDREMDYKSYRSMSRRDLLTTLSKPTIGTPLFKKPFTFYENKKQEG